MSARINLISATNQDLVISFSFASKRDLAGYQESLRNSELLLPGRATYKDYV